MEITGWVIEYWDPVLKVVSLFSSLDGDWETAPVQQVIYVWFYLGGYAEYTVGLKGTDYYFFNGVIFGCFNNAIKDSTSHDGHGSYYEILGGESIRTWTPDHARPAFVEDNEIKDGIWVTEPRATDLGFSPDSTGPRTKPELRQYT